MADVNDYLIPAGEVPESEAPRGTAADFAKTFGAGATGIGSNLAAGARYFYEAGNSPNGADIAQGLQKIFSAGTDAISDTINPETKKLAASTLTSPEFWEHPILASALKTTGMLPAVAALAIPGGLLADAVGATMIAGAGGAVINAGAGLDEFYKKLDGMTDEELQTQSSKYKALRELFDEKAARTRFNKEAQGWGPAINAVIGAAASVVGPAGTAARGLTRGAENAVAGAGERGALASGGIGAAEGAVGNAVQAGAADVVNQNTDIEAELTKHFDTARAANAALEGGALGGLMGGAVGIAAGGKPTPRKSATAETVADVVAPQPKTGSATTVPAKPAEIPDIGNPKSAPTRSSRDGAKTDTTKAPTEVAAPQPIAPSADIVAAVKANESPTITAQPTEHAALTEGSPNETLDKLNQEPAPKLDTGQNVPEQPASLAEQIKQIGTGDRKAVMYPSGTVVPAAVVPTGFKKTKTPRGSFIYDPKLTSAGEIQKLSRLGRENELLGLGPVSKPEAVSRVAAGETPVAVTERTGPNSEAPGTEVKAAAGTDQTAPQQTLALEAQKTPGNVVAVEKPETVLQMRQPGEPPKEPPIRTGRILPNLTQTAETVPLSDFNRNKVVEAKEPKGKNYSKEELAAKEATLSKAKEITDKHAPSELEDKYLTDPAVRDTVIARAQRMVADADAAGVKVQAQLKKSTKGDALSDHPSIQILRAAKDLAKIASKRKAGREITEATGRFAEAERLIRGGYSDEVLAQRREEGDAAMKRGPKGEETSAATEVTPESELAKKEGADVVSTEEANVTPEGKADTEKDQVKTAVQKSAKGDVRGVGDGTETTAEGVVRAKAANAGRVLSAEEKAAYAEKYNTTAKKEVRKDALRIEAQKFNTKWLDETKNFPPGDYREIGNRFGVIRGVAKTGDMWGVQDRTYDDFSNVKISQKDAAKILGLAAEGKKQQALDLIKKHFETEGPIISDYSVQEQKDRSVKRTADKYFPTAGDALRVDRNPSEAQKAAGNYKKGHIKVDGLDVTLENPRGAIRRGVDEHGEPWEVRMPDHYGYIRRTEGADGDHVDAYVGRSGDKHFVIDQLDHRTGEFDEHKVMLRYKDEASAVEAYKKAFSDGQGEARLGNIHEMSTAELKDWLNHGDTKEPITKHALERDMDKVNFDVPSGPNRRTVPAAEALDKIDFSKLEGIGGTLARFFQSRLKKLADDVDVHYVSRSAFDREHPNFVGAQGLHSRDPSTGRSEVFITTDTPEGVGHGTQGHVLLHELVHAVTVREIESVPGANATITKLAKVASDYFDDHLVELDLEFKGKIDYGFTNAKEFIAEAFSNPHFQDFLSRIPISPEDARFLGLEKRSMSMWDVFRGYVKKIIEKTTGKMPEFDSVLDGIMKVGEHITKIHEIEHAEPMRAARDMAPRVVQGEALRMVDDATEQVRKFLGRPENNTPESAPKVLKLRTFDNIAQIADHYFERAKNPIRTIHEAVERMRVTGQKIFEKSEPLVKKLATLRAANREQFEEFTSLLHDATVADVHPDVALNDIKNAHLGKNKIVGSSVWSKAQHPELAKRYNNLSPELKEVWGETVKHFADTQNKMSLGIINNQILKLMGINDKALGQRIHEGTLTAADRASLGGNLEVIEKAQELSKIEGPYVPLIRRGDHVVKADYKVTQPGNSKKISENEFEFKTEKEATDYAKSSSLQPTIKKVWVDEKTGELHQVDPDTGKEHRMSAEDVDAVARYRVEVQNRHVEFVQGKRAAEARAAELAKDNSLAVHKVVPRAFEPNGRQASELSSALSSLVKKLEKSDAYKQATPTQQATMRHAIEEAALASHGSTRVSSRALPRRGVKGYSEDLIQNTVDYGASSSRYLAKLEHGASLEAGIEEMQSQLKRDHSKTGQYARTAISNEILKRVNGDNGFEQGGKLAPVVKRALSASFIDKLGSPAYSVINAMQPGMVTMPYLSGRHGVGRSFAAMGRAYADINAGRIVKEGIKETGRRITGKRAPEDFMSSIKKNLSPEERAMIDEHIKVGTLDPSAGMEIAELVRDTSGVGGKFDAGLGYLEGVTREMPRAIEAINRAVTAIAAYRLERSRGADHEAAIVYSKDAVNNTQFNYAPTNSPQLFNHPLLKIALQFKKYGQGMYQLIGSQVANAIRNEKPGDRAQAVKTLITLAATHTAIAGALGLPTEPFKYLLMGAHAAGLTAMTWSDVEDKIRHQAANVFGKTGGEVFSRGLPRLLNIDLSRAGLDSVTSFGEPRSQKEADVKSWLFDSLAGPVVSLGGDYIKGLNQIANGNFERAAENMIPLKAASDSLRAYRQYTEGKKSASGKQTMTPYTPTEAALRVLGFGSGREAESGAANSAFYRQSQQQKEQRSSLVNTWVQAKPAEKKDAWASITKWNKDQPADVKIVPKELTDKAKHDAKAAPKAVRGINANKRDKRFLAEGAIYNTGTQ